VHARPNSRRDRALIGALVVLASCAGTGAAGAEGSGRAPVGEGARAESGEKAEIVSAVLDSGVRVYVQRQLGGGAVAVRAAWQGGLRAEPAPYGGAHRLLARMLTRGCGGRSPYEVQIELQELEATMEGVFGRDAFGLHGRFPSATLTEGLELFSDCVLLPRLDASELVRERERLLDELRVGAVDPAYQAFRTLASHLFEGHPYGRDPRGTPESVDRLTRATLATLYRERYPPSAMTLAIVGPVDPDEVLALVKARFGEVPSSIRPDLDEDRDAIARPRGEGGEGDEEVYRFVDADRAFVAFGYRGAALADPDRYALEVTAAILGGVGGRVAAALREAGVAAHDHGALASEALDAGWIALYVDCEPEARSAAYQALARAIEGLASEPPSRAELAAAKAYLVQTHRDARRRPTSRAASIALHAALGLDHARAAAYAELVEAVTASQVAQVASAYVAEGGGVRVTVTPMEMSPEAVRRARGVRRGEAAEP
jgi:zinc protease